MHGNRSFWRWGLLSSTLLVAMALLPWGARCAQPEVVVSLVSDRSPGPAASHGLNQIVEALKAKGVVAAHITTANAARGGFLVVTGLATGSEAAARLLQDFRIDVPTGPEALVIRKVELDGNRPAVIVVGSDDRGLMYGELDVADRVGWAADTNDPLSAIRDTAEKPAVVDRALSMYTMQRRYFEDRLFDEDYWARYFDMLARNRFNRFVVVFGYENGGYMAPMYPYFFDVPGFPDVHVVGLTSEQQKRYLDALNRMIAQAHDRGIEVTLAPWDHIYRAGVQTGGVRGADGTKPTPGLVEGLTQENLMPYSIAALKTLLTVVPHFDSIQFRMHGESGLNRGEMPQFWKAIYQTVKERRPDIRFDARAKEFPDLLIDLALDMDVNIRITTKYWMEQMGMPFHPTHIHPGNQRDRRHGYADLLRYPQRYKMHWRLWNGGTNRVLLWGDPDYARRFAQSTHLYDGEGFEVNEPLATKMEAQPHDMQPFELLNPKYRYYDYEFERYWHFYQVFGRLGYDPNTLPEVWEREFERRFGKDAAPCIERALHRASQILPRIVAYCYPYDLFPTTRGWIEKGRMADLPTYAKALPSDTEQFLGPEEAARLHLAGAESAKIWPLESAAWFSTANRDVLDQIGRAEKQIGRNRNREFDSTIADLRILAHLASYHAARAAAGFDYALYQHAKDLNALNAAIGHERRAIAAWKKLVEAAGDLYNDDLMMGLRRAGLAGHWKDELAALENGLAALKREADAYRPPDAQTGPFVAHVPIRRLLPGKDLILRATVCSKNPIRDVRVVYRTAAGTSATAKMELSGPRVYQATIPAAEVTEGLRYLIEAKDEADRRTTFPHEGWSGAGALMVTDDGNPPAVEHTPIASAPASMPLKITARVNDPSGVKWVRLRYRSVTQFEDYRTLEMKRVEGTDRFEAVIPAERVVPQYDFMYFVEVMDTKGNGTIHPDLEKETPYIVVNLER